MTRPSVLGVLLGITVILLPYFGGILVAVYAFGARVEVGVLVGCWLAFGEVFLPLLAASIREERR